MGSGNLFDSQVKRGGAIALADCNNFFVSCERAFSPQYRGCPALVLSNNDGCVVARSAEVKKLGIPMGTPLFKISSLVKKHKIKVFSSNYQLYADLSKRVVDTMRSVVPDVEVYSVDEAFLDLSKVDADKLYETGKQLRKAVIGSTGIPISVGIASSKTLAKIATDVGKSSGDGVCDFYNKSDDEIDKFLMNFEINDIWGVGRQLTKKLNDFGIKTAFDLKYGDKQMLKKRFSINIYRTIMELNGVSCYHFNMESKLQKSLAYTRSFGSPVKSREKLSAILANFTALACEKLRKQGGIARKIFVFARTSQFATPDKFFFKGIERDIGFHSVDTKYFLHEVEAVMKDIYKEGIEYKKAGIGLMDIVDASSVQLKLFESVTANENLTDNLVINVVDQLNEKWGRGCVMYGSALLAKENVTKRELISKRFTTDWGELLRVG